MIDFQALKARVSISDTANFLNLETKGENGQLRCACPACESSDDRALVITPDKGLFYCFLSEKGGDAIALVAHIKQLSMRAAAEDLARYTTPQPSPKKEEPRAEKEAGLVPLAHLNYDHESLKPLNLTKDTAEKIGIGYASKGLMKGHVAVPVRLPDGTLVGYVGITGGKVPPSWRLP